MPPKSEPLTFSVSYTPPLAVGKSYLLFGFWDMHLLKPYRSSRSKEKGYAVFHFASGSGQIVTEEGRQAVRGGTVFLLSADKTMEIVPDSGAGLHVSELRLDLVGGPPAVAEHAMIRDCLPTLLRRPFPMSTDMYGAWNALRRELGEKAVFHEPLLELLLRQFFIYLYRTGLAADRDGGEVCGKAAQGRVSEVTQYIEDNILYLKNVFEVSEALGYNYSYLSHTFSAETGRSLRDYFLQKRFEKAVELLRDNMSISEVSDMLGYAAVHSFSRAFHRQVGRSPGSFQQKSGLSAHRQIQKLVFDDFDGDVLDWRADQVYGSMKSMEFVPYPKHSGRHSLAMDFNVTSEWRVDWYARYRRDLSVKGMKYLSFWIKATSPVRVEVVISDSHMQGFIKMVDVGTVGAVVCIPLEEFRPRGGTGKMDLLSGVGVEFFFRGIHNVSKRTAGRLFVDDLVFVDTDISTLTEISSRSDQVDIVRGESAILLPPPVIARPRNQTELNELCQGTDHPVGIQLLLHEDLTVYSVFGSPMGSLSSVFVKIYQKVMPVFTVSDQKTADALMAYLNEKSFQDVFILSKKEELIRYVHEQYCILRGILDMTDETADPDTLCALCNANNVRILLLGEQTPATLISALQERQITVWIQQSFEEEELPLRYHRMLTGGAMGLVVDRPKELAEVMKLYGDHTMLHTPLIQAYGYGHQYPWDTLEAAKAGHAAAVSGIVLDIFLTKDAELVAIPEREIEKHSRDFSGNVEDYTWKELDGVRLNRDRHIATADCRIRRLSDFYEAFADTEQRFHLVVYEDEERVIDLLMDLNRRMGMTNRVSYVVGGTAQIQRIRHKIPEAIILNRGLYDPMQKVWLSLPEILANMQLYNSAFSPRYQCSEEFLDMVYNLWCRGITTWPYYFDSREDLDMFFLSGVSGLTTNLIQYIENWTKSLLPAEEHVVMKAGQSRTITARMVTYSGKEVRVSPQIQVLDGPFEVRDDALLAREAGEGHLLLSYTFTIRDDLYYRKYAPPVSVTAL